MKGSLQTAINNQDVDQVRQIIKSNPESVHELTAQEMTKTGMYRPGGSTMLHEAVWSANDNGDGDEIVNLLLDAGLDPFASGEPGVEDVTPVKLAFYCSEDVHFTRLPSYVQD